MPRSPSWLTEATPTHELASRLSRPPGDRPPGDGVRRRPDRPLGPGQGPDRHLLHRPDLARRDRPRPALVLLRGSDLLRDAADGRRRPDGPPARPVRDAGDDDDARLHAPLRGLARHAQGRALHALDVLAARHPGHAGGQQLPGRLPRPRADVALALRARRHAPRRHRRDRGGDEVLRPRRAGERLPALRPVDDVRRDRLARDQRGLQGDRHRPDQPRGARPRHRLRRRRARLQARRRAVPHVGARRLPGRADVDDAARRRRAQARRLRDHDPPARRGNDRRRPRLAADAGAALARVDAARQPGGDRADAT